MIKESHKQAPPDNVHVLPLRRKKEGHRTTEAIDFAGLTSKLEERIGKIESDLKESIQTLKGDIQKTIKTKKIDAGEKNVQDELNALTREIEARIQKSLSALGEKKEIPRQEKDRLEPIKRLSSQLAKTLSFDFYKGVIDRLGSTEYEDEVDPFGLDKNFIEKIKPVFDYLYYKYWRVTTTGTENIPNEGRALIVSNHSGTIPYDGAMLKIAILNEHSQRKDARFLVEDFVYHMPFMGTFMYRIGGIRASPENAEFLLSTDHLLIVFPEGVKGIGKYYRNRYKLQRFGRGGFIKLCMRTKTPIIPAAIVGAEEIHPIIFKSNILAKTIGLPYIPITPTFPLLGLLGCIPLPSKWSIHFGKTIDFGKFTPKEVEDDLLIHKLSERIRGEIQEIIIELLKKRRSVWLG